jgi:hypothetical protein
VVRVGDDRLPPAGDLVGCADGEVERLDDSRRVEGGVRALGVEQGSAVGEREEQRPRHLAPARQPACERHVAPRAPGHLRRGVPQRRPVRRLDGRVEAGRAQQRLAPVEHGAQVGVVGEGVDVAGPGRLRRHDVDVVAERDPVARHAVVERGEQPAVGVGRQHLGEHQHRVRHPSRRESGDLLQLEVAAGHDRLADVDVRPRPTPRAAATTPAAPVRSRARRESGFIYLP